jgi:hypothetical protein
MHLIAFATSAAEKPAAASAGAHGSLVDGPALGLATGHSAWIPDIEAISYESSAEPMAARHAGTTSAAGHTRLARQRLTGGGDTSAPPSVLLPSRMM